MSFYLDAKGPTVASCPYLLFLKESANRSARFQDLDLFSKKNEYSLKLLKLTLYFLLFFFESSNRFARFRATAFPSTRSNSRSFLTAISIFFLTKITPRSFPFSVINVTSSAAKGCVSRSFFHCVLDMIFSKSTRTDGGLRFVIYLFFSVISNGAKCNEKT